MKRANVLELFGFALCAFGLWMLNPIVAILAGGVLLILVATLGGNNPTDVAEKEPAATSEPARSMGGVRSMLSRSPSSSSTDKTLRPQPRFRAAVKPAPPTSQRAAVMAALNADEAPEPSPLERAIANAGNNKKPWDVLR